MSKGRSLTRAHPMRRVHVLTRVPTFSARDTVAHARRVIQSRKDWEYLNYIYLLNGKKSVTGVISIRELLTAPTYATLGSLSEREPVLLEHHATPEQAAILAVRHGLKAVPIVDRSGRFVGLIGADDIMRTLHRAGFEDAIRHSGIHLSHRGLLDVQHGRIIGLTLRRLPWLLIGLAGGFVGSALVGQFEPFIREVVALAFFSPAVVYMGAAVGNQTQALFLRAITIGEVRISRFLAKDTVVNACIGVIVGAISFGAITLVLQDYLLAAIVAIAMLLTISFSGIVSIGMTTALARRKEDPALGAGPFATVIQDVVSLVMYFSVASIILTWFRA